MKYFSKIAVLILLVVTSCKTKKSATSDDAIAIISTKKIIKNHYETSFDQQTINAKLNAKYSDEKKSTSVSIKLRVQKDSVIWMSASKFGLTLAKVIITPDRVSYYEKLKKTYFDGDFSLLSNWLGAELDFDKVQNILLGQAILNLKDDRYSSAIDNGLYLLKPKRENELFDIQFLLNPDNFKINRQEIRNIEKQQLLSLLYSNYQEIEGEQFPENLDIRAIDVDKMTTINIEYRSVEFNKELTFPFTIPDGYKEISLP